MPPKTSSSNRITSPSVRAALARGGDAQSILNEVVDAALSFESGPRDTLNETLPDLIRHGARMSYFDESCPFSRIVSRGGVGLCCDVIGLTESLEHEVPFSVIAKLAPGLIISGGLLSSMSRVRTVACLKKTDRDGRSISHYLWAPDSLVAVHASQVRKAPNPQSLVALLQLSAGTNDVAWALQSMFENLGVGFESVDHAGVPAWRVCMDRVQAGDIELLPTDICNKLRSMQQSAGLQDKTPHPDSCSPVASPRF